MRHYAATILGLASFWLATTTHATETVQQRQIGQMVLEGIPEWDPAIRERLLQYQAVRPASLVDVSDDGQQILISTRFADTAQLHVVAKPMGARKQVTFFDEPVSFGAFVRGSDGKRLVIGKDIGGNENFQYYELNLEDGARRLITDGKSKHQTPLMSPSGKYLAFAGTPRNGRDFDIYLHEIGGGHPPRILLQAEGSFGPGDFSADETRLLVQQYLSERETRWHVIDVATGESQLLTPESSAFYYGGGKWSPDGRYAYFTSDREGEFRKLYQVDLSYGNWKCLTSDIEWDVEEVVVDLAGRGIAFATNEDGFSRLYMADSNGGNRRRISGLPEGVIGGLTFSKDGNTLGFSVTTAREPGDAYTVTLADGRVTRWTESEIGGLNSRNFVDAELVRYPTFDQVDGKPRQIPALVFRGKGEGKRPVVIYVHGGPEGQTQPTFSSTFQYWAVELGITVLCPNVRGSTGYGRSFHQLDNAVKREDSVRDVGALLDWIKQQPDLDTERVGIYGGSYGGYMVLGSLTNFPGRIKAGIDVVGIADFVTFLNNTSEYRRDLRRAEYGDERDPDVRKVLESISPLRNAGKITAALFVAHGENDPRVPVSEARQIVAKMRELGRPVWFANALDEGHGFRKKPNRDLANVLYAAFWKEHLLK